MEFYSTDVGGLSLKVRKTEAGWEASMRGSGEPYDLGNCSESGREHGLSRVGAGS
jgi:hypothetical protein